MKTIEIQENDDPAEIDFEATMEEFACHLMAEAQKTNVKLEEKVKVFEAVQPYHAAREKYKGNQPPASNGRLSTFKDFKSRAQEDPQPEQ